MMRRWYKPSYVIFAGVAFLVACNLGGEPGLKTTLIASVPVLLAFYIFLWMVSCSCVQGHEEKGGREAAAPGRHANWQPTCTWWSPRVPTTI